jgi:catechol-2,3-dioxygenase
MAMRVTRYLHAAIAAVVLPALVSAQDIGRPPAGLTVVGESFLAIQVRDDSAASAWYQRAIGLEEQRHLEAEDGRYSIRILRGDGLTVELIRMRGVAAPPESHFGLFKAGFYVVDIEAAHTWLSEQKVEVDAGIFDDEALEVRTFVFRDLEGNRIQLFQKNGGGE